ncbi:MAG: hypothetical protein HOP12_13760, partial [Candidatus Eisenbacteria bacterium]|nr:hypothetical protein [Candidatus Eisenbacteria bacterium]
GQVLEMPGATPLREAPGTLESSRRLGWLNRDGHGVIPLDRDRRPLTPALAGYRSWGADSLPPRFVAWFGGALAGRRITLDPDGGGDDPGGVGPGGTRASLVNLELARMLEGMLTAAGASVQITRRGDAALSEPERVRISEAFDSERYLRIGHRSMPPAIGHYFSSPLGRRWAQRTAESMERFGLGTARVREDALYPLQQVSCPALFVSPARLDDSTSEARVLAPGALRATAYALLVALAREWSSETAWPLDSLRVQNPAGQPLEGALVTLGGALVLATDREGWIRFERSEAGPLEVSVQDARLNARLVLLESSRGAVVTGPRDH